MILTRNLSGSHAILINEKVIKSSIVSTDVLPL